MKWRNNKMYEFFKLIYHIEFFLIPISAGFLTHAAIKGKKKKPYVMALIISTIVFILALTGAILNAPLEIRSSILTSLEKTLFE